MKPTLPMICVTLLVAMMAAGVSHYWSVSEFVSRYPTTPATRILPSVGTGENQRESPQAFPLAAATPSHSTAQETTAQKEFFEGLLAEMRALRNENRNLIDQVAETNRDMMKMEFRLDTHSESFRPLPTSEGRDDRTNNYTGDLPAGLDNDFPSVLPPRASPVYPLED
jgi:hypothetical protein